MEATLNPLLASAKQSQPGLSTQATDLFSIDSADKFSKEESFSDLLQEKIDKKRSTEAQERNKLPLHGKEEQERPNNKVSSDVDSGDQTVKQRDAEERQSADQQARSEQEKSHQEKSHKESADRAEGDNEQSDELEHRSGSEDDVESVEERLAITLPEDEVLPDMPSLAEAQSDTAELLGPQVVASQQAVTEEPVELDEALVEEEMLKRALAEQGRGRNPNLPPELQKGEQQINVGEELNLKSAMNALKEQHAAGAVGSEQSAGGENPQQGGGQGLNTLFSAVDPLNSTERPVQLKGMTVTPQSRQWSSELGERILFMAGKKIQSAEIRLNPPNLGLMEVKLAISGEQAQLVFQSGNANVRDVLESAVPRIREMLEQSGITLTDVTVSDGKQQEAENSEEGEQRKQGSTLSGLGEGVDEEVVPISSMAVDRIGLVDYYI